MNEELEPLGLPTPSQAGRTFSLSEFVSEHPLVAVAASAAAGAGVMALIAVGTRQREESTSWHGIGSQASDKYAAIQAQLSELLARLADSMPSKDTVARTASDLGDQASKLLNGAVDGASHSIHRASAAGVNVTQTALAHPLVTSLVLGALGTVVAALSSSSTGDPQASSAAKANGSGQADHGAV
jgi:ElaB/YqjD/DUF883 family membrane-anchored ribosome-binding protein